MGDRAVAAVTPRAVVWRRHDLAGHEACRVGPLEDGWQLAGAAVFVDDGRRACRLDYDIACDAEWVTRSAVVKGWIGDAVVDLAIARSPSGAWRLNRARAGRDVPSVQ